jgi:hypothetical protein
VDIVRLKKGEDVNDLAARISTSKTQADIKRTARALKRANPSLAGRAVKAKRDMVVMVPDDVKVDLGPIGHDAPKVGTNLIAKARERVGDASRLFPEIAEREEEQAAKVLENLKGAEVKRASAEHPELKRRLPEITERAKERLEQVRAQTKLQKRALGDLEKDMQALAKLVAAQPGLGRAMKELGLSEGEDE